MRWDVEGLEALTVEAGSVEGRLLEVLPGREKD